MQISITLCHRVISSCYVCALSVRYAITLCRCIMSLRFVAAKFCCVLSRCVTALSRRDMLLRYFVTLCHVIMSLRYVIA